MTPPADRLREIRAEVASWPDEWVEGSDGTIRFLLDRLERLKAFVEAQPCRCGTRFETTLDPTATGRPVMCDRCATLAGLDEQP